MRDTLKTAFKSDLEVWNQAETEYTTKEIKEAYGAMLNMRERLQVMQASGRKSQLDYPYCLALVTGRLFVMSEVMGDTNQAMAFYKESLKYWTEHAISLKLPPEHYSPDRIEGFIRKIDGAGPFVWRNSITKPVDTSKQNGNAKLKP